MTPNPSLERRPHEAGRLSSNVRHHKHASSMRILQTPVALLLSTILLACTGTLRITERSEDLVALQAVVESFRTSIVQKDKPRFVALFFSDKPELVTWQAVVDDPSLRWIQKTRPQAVKARYRLDNNFVTFIDGIIASKSHEEEKFSNLRIDTDGEVASISFDYIYLTDGRATNRGREKWLLVRTEQGWRITSVVYTIHLPEAESGV